MPRARARGARAGLLHRFCVCAAAIAVSIATSARAQTVEQFYSGKQVKFVVGSAGDWGPVTVQSGRRYELTLVRTDDGGHSWHPSSHAPAGVTSVCFTEPDDGWVGAGGRVWRTRDAGTTWARAISDRLLT